MAMLEFIADQGNDSMIVVFNSMTYFVVESSQKKRYKIPQAMISRITMSMRRRLQYAANANGGYTRHWLFVNISVFRLWNCNFVVLVIASLFFSNGIVNLIWYPIQQLVKDILIIMSHDVQSQKIGNPKDIWIDNLLYEIKIKKWYMYWNPWASTV